MPEAWFRSGEAIIQWVQTYRHPALDALFAAGSFLGEEVFFLVFLPLVYWCIDATLGRWLAYALLTSAYLNSVLKYVFLTPRPPEVYWHHVLRPEGPGFPSGHAQVGATFWGTAAAKSRSTRFRVALVILVAIIAFSRVYNGVHYPHDVIGGLLIGLVWLGVLLALGSRLAAWAERMSTVPFVGVITVGAALLILAHPPQEGVWPASSALSLVGTLWGMSLGFWWERRRVGYRSDGHLWQRVARGVVGLLAVAAIYLGLAYVAPAAWALPARFVRYALLGLVVAWGMPWFFRRVGL